MPTPWHDAVTLLFKEDPGFAPKIVQLCTDKVLPDGLPATVGSPEFNDRVSKDFYADAVVVVGGQPRDPVYGVIVEPQRGKDDSKFRSWPRYAAAFWLSTGKPAYVLALFADQEVADWYASMNPIETTLPGYRLPVVIVGPKQIPVITDAEAMLADMA